MAAGRKIDRNARHGCAEGARAAVAYVMLITKYDVTRWRCRIDAFHKLICERVSLLECHLSALVTFSSNFAFTLILIVPLRRVTDLEEMHDRVKRTLHPSPDDDQEQLKAIKDQIAELETSLGELKAQAKRLPSLSPSALIQLDKLDNRLRHLKVDVQNHNKSSATPNGLNGQGSRTSSSTVAGRSLEAPLPKGWERGKTEENIPYYMNHAEESTQWDHPKYSGM